MKKPSYAIAIELRMADKELNEKFNSLPDIDKWEWLAFATKNTPFESINFAKQLIGS